MVFQGKCDSCVLRMRVYSVISKLTESSTKLVAARADPINDSGDYHGDEGARGVEVLPPQVKLVLVMRGMK